MPSNIPKAREIVDAVRKGERPLHHLLDALTLMTRDKPLRQAGIKSNRVNKEIRDAVKRDLADPAFADRDLDFIGRRHNVKGGRVTEINQGQYDHL